MKILLRLERETKGALRYQEIDEEDNVVEIPQGAKLGMMYIRKVAFEGKPEYIRVTLEEL